MTMQEVPLFLGIDAGTQGLKALVYDASSRKAIGRGSVAYGLEPTNVSGRAEQDPARWVEALYAAAEQALQEADKARGGSQSARRAVRGIGVSGQQHGLVALDENYQVIRPAKLWCDTESAGEAAELAEKLGWGIVASFTITKLLWMKRKEPENFKRLAHVALPHDYINYLLTGRLVMECGDASGTGLLEVESRRWDGAAAALVDPELLRKMPPLVAPNEAAGRLTAEVSSRLALPPGLLVAPGGGDNMMSALGCGCCKLGRCAVSLGTSGTLFAQAPAAIRDPSGAICPFLDACGAGLPLLCTLNCTVVPEEVRLAFGLQHEEITRMAEQEPPGCEGLTFLPYLAGERTPNWPGASGAIVGLRAGHLARPGLLYRAAIEGATFSLRAGFDSLHRFGVAGGELRLVGGGSKNRLWRQVAADIFQMRVACPVEPESAALGAALQAAALDAGAAEIGAWIVEQHDAEVSDVVEANPENAAAYAAGMDLFLARGGALFAPTAPVRLRKRGHGT